MKTGLTWDDRFLQHKMGPGHPECPDRLVQIKNQLVLSKQWDELERIGPLEDPLPYLKMVHTENHIKRISLIPNTGTIAELACRYTLGAVKSVFYNETKNAFCAVRPPGHHANNTGKEEGFCFFNNIAVAVKYAQKEFGYKNILIVDWDYHHGNGTQNAFYNDPTVMYFSTHRWDDYPGTGDPNKNGDGAGFGFNVNVDLPDGATDLDIINAFEKHLCPRMKSFKPEFILISAGFDGREQDTLGTFKITDYGFKKLTCMVMDIAREAGHNRVVSVLEGGYNTAGLASAVSAHIEALQKY